MPTIESTCDFRLPFNANDLDLLDATPFHEDPGPLTDATLTILQHECNMVYRLIFNHQGNIDDGLRVQVDKQRKRIESTYLDNLSSEVPLQLCAKYIGRNLILGFDVLMNHKQLRYERDAVAQQRLHNRYVAPSFPKSYEITSLPINCSLTTLSLQICETVSRLEVHPDLAPWAWYARPFQCCPSALLLNRINNDPQIPQADRINAVMEHLFGTAPTGDNQERNRDVLEYFMRVVRNIMQEQAGGTNRDHGNISAQGMQSQWCFEAFGNLPGDDFLGEDLAGSGSELHMDPSWDTSNTRQASRSSVWWNEYVKEHAMML